MRNERFPQLNPYAWSVSLCFTGHRPSKLPRGEALFELRATLNCYIDRAVARGYRNFYTGLADGIDLYAAEHLLEKKRAGEEIAVIGVQPFQKYEEFFKKSGYNTVLLAQVKAGLDTLVILPEQSRSTGAFMERNRLMVDHCSGIIAVCGAARSGSGCTLDYAKARGLAYCRISPNPPPRGGTWEVETSGF